MARRGRKFANTYQTFDTLPDLRAKGGCWAPLDKTQIATIGEAAIKILTTIGVSEAPDILIDVIQKLGGSFVGGRLFYPQDLVERAIKDGPKKILLAGQLPKQDLKVGGSTVYTGTGGAAPNVFDEEKDEYRSSTLADLYAAARLADTLPHIHFFSRSLVARDVEDPLDFDLSTAVASLLGTSKHVMVQAAKPAHVSEIAELCYEIAGGEHQFRSRPFLSLNINHVVPPLRMHFESIHVMETAVRAGIPVHCNVFGQLGASSPVTLAGSVAQTLAETLAGLSFVHALDPKAPRLAGPRPMVTDLRTGGMAGGSGEQAMATGVAVQVLGQWGIPCSVIAGATDSKLTDFQAGFEKTLTIQSALQSGAHLITQAAGTQAGLMGVNYGAMVADNEMIGAILRGNVSPEITSETLALEAISEVVAGEGHFFGRAETYARMRSDFLYPKIADRSSIDEWESTDRADMGQRAARAARDVLENHWPSHGPAHIRTQYLRRFGI